MMSQKKQFVITRREFSVLLTLLVVLLCVFITLTTGRTYKYNSSLVVCSFVPCIIISLFGMLAAAKRYSFSFRFMFWFFNLFFFGIAPLLQYITSSYAWAFVPTDDEIVLTNLLIFLWCTVIALGSRFGRRYRFVKKKYEPAYYIVIPRTKVLVLTALCLLILLYKVSTTSIAGLFTRESSGNTNAELSTMASLIESHFIKNTLVFALAIVIWRRENVHRIGIEGIIILLCFILCCFPTAMSRNAMAACYGGLFILTSKWAKRSKWLNIYLVAGLVLVFPAINIFRTLTYQLSRGISIGDYIRNSLLNTYIQGDYDAHQMFMSIQRYVDEYGFSYGYQLLGALLFFIPRSLWPNKPIGTGATVISGLNQFYFTNVSAPLIGEVYINFGLFGILIIGFILGMLIYRADNAYWNKTNKYSYIRLFYPFLMLMFFFIERGDLLSSGSYTFAMWLFSWLMYKWAIIKVRE